MNSNMPAEAIEMNDLSCQNFIEENDFESVSSAFSQAAYHLNFSQFGHESTSSLPSAVRIDWQQNPAMQTMEYDFEKRSYTLPPLASVFGKNKLHENQEVFVAAINANDIPLTQNVSTFQRQKMVTDCEHFNAAAPECTYSTKDTLRKDYISSARHTTISSQSCNLEVNSLKPESTHKRNVHVCDGGALPPNVNVAFKKLRNLIPTEPVDRRLSKVETLRLAVSYIQHLGHTLNCDYWVEQPCLTKATNQRSGSPICTFCMSKRRKVYPESR